MLKKAIIKWNFYGHVREILFAKKVYLEPHTVTPMNQIYVSGCHPLGN